MPAKRTLILSALALAFSAGVGPVHAQDWPQKPLRLIVTFSPGGSSDIVARALAVPLAAKLGQPIVVENKPGAGGSIGASEVARAAPDGYTLLMSNTTPMSLSPIMLDPSPYDPIKSFTHVSLVATVPDVILAHPSVGVKTLAELQTWIKAQPKAPNYGSGGVGSIGHVLGETFKTKNSLAMDHVGYRGSAPMILDLIGGQLSFSFDTLPQNVPHIKAQKLVPLAVTSEKRHPLVPDLPTVGELGLPYLTAENFIGVSAPAGLPEGTQKKLHEAVQAALTDSAFAARLAELGLTVRPMSQNDFNTFVAKQINDWAPAVKASGAKLN